MSPEPVLKKGDHIELALFDDAVLDAEISNVTLYSNRSVGLTAHLRNGREGTLFLSYYDGQMSASVQMIGGADFCVRYNPETRMHYAVEVDRANSIVLEGAEPKIPSAEDAVADAPASLASSEPVALVDAPAGSTIVDVMIVYTPAARAWADNHGGIENNIALAMQKANEAHTNSNTQVYLNLIHSAEVNYTEVNADADLYNLTYSGGTNSAMDEVHTWRDQYGADLICLFESTEAVGGLGWLLSSTGGRPDYAFCLARVQQSDWTYTVVHEWGHNMGCSHSKTQTVQPWDPASSKHLYSYSAGWQWSDTKAEAPAIGYCSVMTYEDMDNNGTNDHIRVGYFSNPGISYVGNSTNAMGHAADGDNALTIRTMKTVLSGYRASAPSVTLSLSGSPMAESGGAARVTATLSKTYTQPVTVNLAFSGTATWTNDYTAASSFTIPAGSTTNSIVLTAVPDSSYESNETIIVNISSVVNGTESGAQQVTATITDDDPELGITPLTGVYFTGAAGGVTTPSNQVYVLTNAGASTLNWVASRTSGSWMSLSETNGTLATGSATNVTVSVNTGTLAEGSYSAVITFSNTTRGVGTTRTASLTVTPPYVYYFPLNTDPGWTRQGEWAFGHPTGQGGGAEIPYPDPFNGATGTNVFGVNLNGNYSKVQTGGPYYLTAGPFNFSNYTNVILHFQRWLNTDIQDYASATIEVSSNGTSWTQIYSNSSATETISTNWSKQTNNISRWADRQTNVYIRWVYKTIPGLWDASGWNIDDIGFLGTSIASAYTVTFDAQGGAAASPSFKSVTNGAAYGTLAATVRAGYAFGGWWTGAGGTGTEVTSSTTVTITGAQTLYAKWTASITSQGTPCPWLDQYGLVSGGDYEVAALADADGDGCLAWQEYIAGTNPTNRQSFFNVSSFDTPSGGAVIRWTAVSGRVYGVHRATNLLSSFQPLGANIVWPQASYTDTAHSAEVRSFYKVKVQLAE